MLIFLVNVIAIAFVSAGIIWLLLHLFSSGNYIHPGKKYRWLPKDKKLKRFDKAYAEFLLLKKNTDNVNTVIKATGELFDNLKLLSRIDSLIADSESLKYLFSSLTEIEMPEWATGNEINILIGPNLVLFDGESRIAFLPTNFLTKDYKRKNVMLSVSARPREEIESFISGEWFPKFHNALVELEEKEIQHQIEQEKLAEAERKKQAEETKRSFGVNK